jgi:hypothetical protein
MPLPRPLHSRILRTTITWDVVIAFCAFWLALIAASKYAADGYGWLVYLLPLVVLGATIWKSYLNWRKDSSESQISALEGALHVMNRLILDADVISPTFNPKLRLTIHVPEPDGDDLIQLLDYVGNQRRKNTAGRKTRGLCGVIGEAKRTQRIAVGSRIDPDYEKYVEELTDKWHYTEEEARRLDPASLAWLAFPLVDGKRKVIAILFADSADKDFFTPARIELITKATTGLAEFVLHRLI